MSRTNTKTMTIGRYYIHVFVMLKSIITDDRKSCSMTFKTRKKTQQILSKHTI